MENQIERLVEAASEGDDPTVRSLIASGVPVDSGNLLGETALMAATRGGYTSIVRFLIEEASASVDTRFPDKGDHWTALMYAAYFGRLDELRFLVENGADFTLKNSDNVSVLEITPCMNATLIEVQDAAALALQTKNATRDEFTTISFGQLQPNKSSTLSQSSGARSADLESSTATSSSAPTPRPGAGKPTASAQEASSAATAATQRWTGSIAAPFEITDIVAARPKMVEVYQTVCTDFELEPEESIIAAVCDPTHDIPETGLGALVLGGYHLRTKLGDHGALPLLETLAHAFPNAPLHTIDLSYTGIGDAAVKVLASFMTQTTALQSLNLEGNDIGASGAEALAAVLPNLPSMKELFLSGNSLGDAGTIAIADAVAQNNNLVKLEMCSTDMGITSLIKYSQLLRRPKSQLVRLALDSPILTTVDEEAVVHFARALPFSSVQYLSLAKFRISDHGARWIADMLARNDSINELNLRCNRITPTGVAELIAALQVRSAPCFINLDGNHLREQMLDEVDEALSKAVPDARCSVQYETGVPEVHGEIDHFKHQRHALISRPL